MPTQHGAALYKGHEPKVDAGIVTILRAAGALIYGKTVGSISKQCSTAVAIPQRGRAHCQVTTEYAFMRVGQKTMNPFDKRRTPGGSSSGSAAAVADWQCQVALGTQTVSPPPGGE
jgi:Asp-tRNA(Asn)/Glu-tRNA(Gln) amidotransferase A subunit family amidase